MDEGFCVICMEEEEESGEEEEFRLLNLQVCSACSKFLRSYHDKSDYFSLPSEYFILRRLVRTWRALAWCTILVFTLTLVWGGYGGSAIILAMVWLGITSVITDKTGIGWIGGFGIVDGDAREESENWDKIKWRGLGDLIDPDDPDEDETELTPVELAQELKRIKAEKRRKGT